MKRQIAKMLIGTLAITLLLSSLSGCANQGDPNAIEKVDTSRTQLYVYNFDGGYGTEWLLKAKEQFEKLHKDDVWEDGKQGVQVYLNPQKEVLSQTVLDGQDEVYFTEGVDYRDWVSKGAFADITEAVSGTSASLADYGEFSDEAGSTIENKLTQQQKDWFGIVESDGATHYYAVPHYAGYYSMFYNVDLFDANNYYLAKTPTGSDPETREILDYFVDPVYNPEKSYGPDGKTGTEDGIDYSEDDGLPATYDEFFMLCDYIASKTHTPLIWSGADHISYVNAFAQALYIDYEGVERGSQDYTLTGVADDLGTVDASGKFVKGDAYVIEPSTSYKLIQREGRYQVLQFIEKLITTKKTATSSATKYLYDKSFNGALSHLSAQEDFLYSGYDGVTQPIGMLVDGIWWEEEASLTFNEMASSIDSDLSKAKRRFAIMPFPKAAGKEGEKNTLFDHIKSAAFIKKGIVDWKKPLALDFLKFVNTDAQLVQFTQITDTPKALEYALSDMELNEMSPYGRSLMELKHKSDVVYPYSSSSLLINNTRYFVSDSFWSTKDNSGRTLSSVSSAFYETNVTAAEYFNGLVKYRQSHWNELTI